MTSLSVTWTFFGGFVAAPLSNTGANPLTTAVVPEGVDDAAVRHKLIRDYGIEIGGGFGQLQGKIWRVGLMGEGARETNVFALLSALETILPQQGYEVAYGASLAAAQRALVGFGSSG